MLLGLPSPPKVMVGPLRQSIPNGFAYFGAMNDHWDPESSRASAPKCFLPCRKTSSTTGFQISVLSGNATDGLLSCFEYLEWKSTAGRTARMSRSSQRHL